MAVHHGDREGRVRPDRERNRPTVSTGGTASLVGSTLRGALHDGSTGEFVTLSQGQSIEFAYAEVVKVRSAVTSVASSGGATLWLDVLDGSSWTRFTTGYVSGSGVNPISAAFAQGAGARFRIVSVTGTALRVSAVRRKWC